MRWECTRELLLIPGDVHHRHRVVTGRWRRRVFFFIGAQRQRVGNAAEGQCRRLTEVELVSTAPFFPGSNDRNRIGVGTRQQNPRAFCVARQSAWGASALESRAIWAPVLRDFRYRPTDGNASLVHPPHQCDGIFRWPCPLAGMPPPKL